MTRASITGRRIIIGQVLPAHPNGTRYGSGVEGASARSNLFRELGERILCTLI